MKGGVDARVRIARIKNLGNCGFKIDARTRIAGVKNFGDIFSCVLTLIVLALKKRSGSSTVECMLVGHVVAGSNPVHSADYVIKNIKKAFNR